MVYFSEITLFLDDDLSPAQKIVLKPLPCTSKYAPSNELVLKVPPGEKLDNGEYDWKGLVGRLFYIFVVFSLSWLRVGFLSPKNPEISILGGKVVSLYPMCRSCVHVCY